MNTFFTADTHFGHANIIKYCNRPFSNAREMDEELIKRWNQKISKGDKVYHLGDFAFGNSDEDFNKYFNRLNGEINFIKGNHDSLAWRNKNKFFYHNEGYQEVKINNQSIVLCHYAMLVWNKSHHGAWHLYGHSHGSLPDNENSMSFDCGVDTNNYYPYSFDDIKEKMSKKKFLAIDHHGSK